MNAIIKDIVMSSSFIYFSISILLIVLFGLCMKHFLGGYTPRKVLKGIDKSLSKSHLWQVFILVFFIFFSFAILLFIGTSITSLWEKDYQPPFWKALGHFLNPGYYDNDDGIANGWIFVINIFGMTLMTGLLISVLSNILERRVDNIKNGRISYSFRKHFVIIGYTEMTISLIKQLHSDNHDAEIVLQTIQKVPAVRHKLFSYIDDQIEDKLTILSGNRNSKDDLKKLYLSDAEEIFLLGENDEFDHDSLNIECLKLICSILPANDNITRKKCHVLFENQSTYTILQQRDIQGISRVEFCPFNFYEKWAENVFITDSVHYCPLDRIPIREESAHTVHLVIVGMSKMGVALAIEATHICHFPNFIAKNDLKTRITFIDKNADEEMHFLQGRYQSFFDEIDYGFENIKDHNEDFKNISTGHFTDIEWQFIKGGVEHPEIQKKIADFSNEKNTLLTIAVCLNDPAVAIATGMYFNNEVYQSDKIKHFDQFNTRMPELSEDERSLFNVQILIKQDTPYSILSMLGNTNKYYNVRAFGMLNLCPDISNSDDRDIPAKKVHYTYDYYFKNNKQIPASYPEVASLDAEWDKIPIVEKWSNRYHTNMINVKQRSFDIGKITETGDDAEKESVKLIDLIAKVEHNRWNIEKLLMGFRPARGSEQNIPKKELKKSFIHPDIKKYEDISEEMKDIDRMITKVLPLIIKDKEQ